MTRAIGIWAVLGSLANFAAAQQLELSRVSTGHNQPVFLTAPAGDSRLFVVEKGGTIDIVQNGVTLPTPFLNITNLVDANGERGLLGLAFDPDFATNGRFYVDYIDKVTLQTVVARYQVSMANPNLADTGTAQTIISVAQPPGLSNHKGGWIGFRPGETSNLYIATGDGGSGNDPDNRAQNLNDNLGKMLRIDVSGNTTGYTIPASNPFAGATPGNDEIWAYGLRNPFRNSFDRVTGDFYIGDVGQNTREEVDFVAAGSAGGQNFGWRALEGSGDNPGVPDAPPAGAIGPIFSYAHADQPAGSASISGGYVYRGSLINGFQGNYLFGDFVNGTFTSFTYSEGVLANLQSRTNQLDPNRTLFGQFTLSSFGEDGFGELYAVDISGEIYQVIPEPQSGALLLLAATAWAGFQRRRQQPCS